MAEETIDIPATPEKLELKGEYTRRNSTGNLSISKNGVKALPRYLSDSMGSCHDLCKYGLKNVHEEKARNPTPKRIAVARSGEGQDRVKDLNMERKKKSAINPKHLPDSKNQTIDKHQVIEKEAPASSKKVAVSSKHFSSPGGRRDVFAKHATDSRPKHVQSKPSSFSTPQNLSSRRDGEIIISKGVGDLQESLVGGSSSRWSSNTSKEMRVPKLGKIKDLVPPTVSLFPRPPIKKELSAKSGNNLKSRSSVRKAEPKQPIDEEVQEKMIYVIEMKPEKPTQNGSDTTHSSHSLSPSSGDKKLGCGRIEMHSSRSPLSSKNKKLRCNQNVSHTSRSSSSLFSCNSSLRHNVPSSSSSLSLLSSSSYASESMKSDESDPVSEGSETKIENQKPNHKVEHSSRPRRVGGESLEDKVGSPQKLDFKVGKVVDVPSRNTSPSRLTFKQRRVLGENQLGNADAKQTSLKKVIAIEELNGSETEPTRVVLRHQAVVEVEGKTGSKSSFNNVIEETASKLVEIRKSKVKALVGAFETLISLQDSKSLATTNSSLVAKG